LQKLWAIYLKACGLLVHAFDAIHALGTTTSHKWAAITYGILSSELKMKKVQPVIHKKPWMISHNSVNLPLRVVFSQCLYNQSHFVSGCVATMWVLPDEAALPADTNWLLQKH
jgi:hypothetical protein